MKKLVFNTLYFGIILILIHCSSSEKQKANDLLISNENTSSTINSKKENKEVDYFIKPLSDSTFTGEAEEKYPNGIVKYKGFYRFGKKHGEWIYFYPNGKIWSEARFNRDKMHGESKVYYPNGNLYYSGFYKYDLKDSVWTYYDSTGIEKYKEVYLKGKLIKKELSKK
ncbi:MAG: hypothetical protein N2203_06360 [Bacteroidia bacterium]|nr:hypothetical protein [Bacteroidia bacterium]